jgi:hypothetical protein
MDVVDTISDTPIDINTSKPYTDIVIQSITLSQYIDNTLEPYVIPDIEAAKKQAITNYTILENKLSENVSEDTKNTEKVKKDIKRADKIKKDINRIAKSGDEV